MSLSSPIRVTPGRTPPSASPTTRLPVWVVLLSGLLVRLALSPFGAFETDVETMREWARRLVSLPLSEFYTAPRPIDHLPGDLWFHWLTTHVYHLLSPDTDFGGMGYLLLLKLVPILADTGIGILLYLLGRRLGGRKAGLVAATLYTLNPAPIFLSAIWGQWDSLSACFALFALWLLLGSNAEWSFPVLTLAALIKPQFAALMPLFVAVFALQHILPHLHGTAVGSGQKLVLRILVVTLGSLVVLIVVPLPFSVGVLPLYGEWSLWHTFRSEMDGF